MTPPDYDPLIVQIIRQQKSDLLEAERGNMADLTGLWLNMESRLNPAMDALALEIQTLRAEGRLVTLESLLESSRYRALVSEARRELTTWLNMAGDNIASFQRFFGQLAMSDSYEALAFGLAEYGRVAGFQTLTPEILESLVGFAGDGSTLRSLLDPALYDSLDGMTRYILNAGVGDDLVRAMQNGMGLGFNRALNTARTETLRVYREVTRQQWAQSGLVKKYKRVATHDERVCAGCLMSEGELYSIDDSLPEHPQGRCFMVPVFVNLPTPQWVGGADWFRMQPESVQRSILGPGRYDAWVSGKYDLSALVTRQHDSTWGGSVVPTPLNKLI